MLFLLIVGDRCFYFTRHYPNLQNIPENFLQLFSPSRKEIYNINRCWGVQVYLTLHKWHHTMINILLWTLLFSFNIFWTSFHINIQRTMCHILFHELLNHYNLVVSNFFDIIHDTAVNVLVHTSFRTIQDTFLVVVLQRNIRI